MLGDIVQDQFGWFFHDNGDGTLDSLSEAGGESPTTARKIRAAEVTGPVVLVRNGQPTTEGDSLARRVALALAKRYHA